jgi:hypothetical protein
MPQRSGLNPNWRSNLPETPDIHPIVSAVQFNALTKQGGASMDPRTGEVLESGKDDVILIGGEKNTRGTRIPTTYYNKVRSGSTPKSPDINPAQVMTERRRISKLTGDRPGVYMGSYVSPDEPEKGVQIDASAGVTDRSKVMPILEERNEESAWDNKNETLIMNPKYNPKGKKK